MGISGFPPFSRSVDRSLRQIPMSLWLELHDAEPHFSWPHAVMMGLEGNTSGRVQYPGWSLGAQLSKHEPSHPF